MRILALRGANLASLAGSFEIDFRRGALGGAGLFAITGPTGAGKSTLLDAICLALYGTTPRLNGTGGPRIGRRDQDEAERLSALDARGLLHRGSSRGFAEVDFEGAGGTCFRARWEVRRARDRADGRVQPAAQSLWNLDEDRALGGTNTETLAAIRESLGLSFDQFRRSALLAQGDFAAFLHAKARDRAELLEKVTGTGIYAAISRRAFEQAKESRQGLEQLTQQLDRLELLPAEERQEFEARRTELEASVRRRQEAVEAARVAVAWFETLTRLRSEREQAEHALQRAHAEREAAAHRRDHFARVVRVAPHRTVLVDHDEAALRLHTAQHEHQEALAAVRRAEQALAEAVEQEAAATRNLREAVSRREAAAPELARATELDALLREARAECDRARAQAEARERHVQQRERALNELVAARQKVEERRTAARSWSEANQHLRGLAESWGAVEAAIRDHVESTEGVRRLDRELQQAATVLAQREEALQKARRVRDEARERLGNVRREVREAEEQLRPDARDVLARRRAEVERLREHALRAVSLAEQAARDAAEAAEEQSGRTRAEARAREAEVTLEALTQQLERLGDRLDEARRARDQARAVMQLEAHRAELRPGEACPLCGATEHPWASGAPVVEGALADRVRELEAEQKHLAERRARTEAERVAALDQGERARQRWAELQSRLTAHREGWAALDPLTLPEQPDADDALERARTALAAATEELSGLDEQNRALSALERRAAEARTRRDEALARVEAAERTEREADTARREAEERRSALEARADRARDARAAAWRAIVRAWPQAEGVQPEFEASAAEVARRWEREVTIWRRAEIALAETQTELETLSPRVAAADSDLRAARASATEAGEAAEKARSTLEALEQARAGVLGGRPVAEAKGALDSAVETEERREASARARVSETRAAEAAAKAAREGSARALAEATDRQKRCREAVQGLLAAEGLTLEALRELLAHDDGWIAREREALDALEQASQEAATVLGERTRQLGQHEASRPEGVDEEGAADRLEAARTALDEDVQALHLTRLRLARDDESRAEAALLVQQRDAQARTTALWGRVSDLIGSADGSKFRRFAQGLTLDALLVQANHQLEALAPRYRLERVPGEDLELQVVDRHMGDEVRAIPSLSGGETFLASLALALGLATLSAATTPVRSLFIDEGFGTLDRQTLETVMAALDALQAQGRQVGIISHVEGLAEQVGVQVRVERVGGGRSRVIPPPGSGTLDMATAPLDLTREFIRSPHTG